MKVDRVLFDVTRAELDDELIHQTLQQHGFVVLRGLFTLEQISEANRRIDVMASAPAVAGVPGYCKVDHPKKLMSPFSIGGPLVDLCPSKSREAILRDAIKDAIEALEQSRKAFKSKQLEVLRKKLTRVLIETP